MKISAAEAFGDSVDISIRLPTRDQAEAVGFLGDITRVVRTSWSGRKFEYLGNERWKLVLDTPLPPGLGSLEPSMIVQFTSREGEEGIFMNSEGISLKGTGPIFKDNDFKDSFNLSFTGFIKPEKDEAKIMYYIGQVEYKVFGQVPGVFQAAPPQILRGAIVVIKKAIEKYAINEVTMNINKEFRTYLVEKKKTKTAPVALKGGSMII